MFLRRTAFNYAKALFALKASPEVIQKRRQDLEFIVHLMSEVPDTLQILCYPQLAAKARLDLMEKLLQIQLDPILKQFLGVILKRGKAILIVTIAAEYGKLIAMELKTIDVEVLTAEPLSEKSRKLLLEKLGAKFKKMINLAETIQPKLLGGFVILIGNKLLDLSIKGQATSLKKQLMER